MIFGNIGGLGRTLASASWLLAVAAGFGAAWRYEATPGASARSVDWPAGTTLRLDPNQTTLVQFVHPECPCSRAGLDEIADLSRGRARLTVVVVGESGDAAPLARSGNARRVRALVGVGLALDPRGEEARRFGAAISGQTFAYSPQGRLLFSGGVTAARGHYGESAGLDAIAAVLRGEAAPTGVAPVFGCALSSEAQS